MAYISRELIDVQNPTKGKIYITVNNKMDLQLHGVPSFGERTEDGKCYDYEKEVVTSLTLKECVQLLAFTDADKLSASVSFVRDIKKGNGYLSKKISFEFVPDKTNPTKVGYVVIKFRENTAYADKKVNSSFDIPLNKDELLGLKYVLRGYVNNYTVLKCDYIKQGFSNQQFNNSSNIDKFQEEESKSLFPEVD